MLFVPMQKHQDGKMCNYSKRLLASSVTQMIVLINKLKETGNAIPSEEHCLTPKLWYFTVCLPDLNSGC